MERRGDQSRRNSVSRSDGDWRSGRDRPSDSNWRSSGGDNRRSDGDWRSSSGDQRRSVGDWRSSGDSGQVSRVSVDRGSERGGGRVPNQYQQQGGDGGGRVRGGGWGPNGNYPLPAHHYEAYRSSGQEPAGGVGRHVSGRRDGVLGMPPSERLRGPQQQPNNLTQSISYLTVSRKPLLPLQYIGKNNVTPTKRPDHGGTHGNRWCSLLVNHFPVKFSENTTINHYDMEIKYDAASNKSIVKRKPVLKSEMRDIREKLFIEDPARFPLDMTAYDGEKNIFSAIPLPPGNYKVQLSDGEGEDRRTRDFIVSIRLVNEVKLSKLKSYLNGEVMDIPREILHGMDVVMKENPSRHRISFGRGSFPKDFKRSDDLGCGVAAFRGFQQSLKPTSKGLTMCLDYSVMALRKRMSVIDYLKENVYGFRGVEDVCRSIHEVTKALKGLKVTVTHRTTKQKYTIGGLTRLSARHLMFDLVDPGSKGPPKKIDLVSYFKAKYDKEIEFKDIPCLDVGNYKRKNYLPMEFALLADGQRYQKEKLTGRAAGLLKSISMLPPKQRMDTINEMVLSDDGPCGGKVIGNFNMGVIKDMTKVAGRVIKPPSVVVGNGKTVTLHTDTCQWNLLMDSVVNGIDLKRWALIDFISGSRGKFTNDFVEDPAEGFAKDLARRCRDMGIQMNDCLVLEKADMNVLSDVGQVRMLLNSVILKASQKTEGGPGLQLIVCVMTKQHPGYKNLKWVSETQIGVLTQCCLSLNAYNNGLGKDKFLGNLALKINAKLGGINFKLKGELPFFGSLDGVMFIGADVNHPPPSNTESPSIAAVVATIGLDKYIARVCTQEHRKERIVNFGSICLELVNTYAAQHKGVKPEKIVVFRDGVSEGQFDMVINEELLDLKRAIYEETYQPTITVVVVQKKHKTHLLLDNEGVGKYPGNVLPGTVVDTEIVQPSKFDFYLCSHHFGQSGSSKPTHYYVLLDENEFSSDKIQELIYHLCFTFPCSTKPLSLVPPVYYADIVAGRGRKFQEVMEDNPLSRSSSTSSVSLSSSNLSEVDFFKLHPDLEDFMVFI